MRNSISKIFSIILLIISFASCKDILQLEPAQSLSNETALDNDQGVKQALIGAYDNISQSSLLGGELMRNAELYAGAGEIIWVGTFTAPREIWLRDILVNNIDVNGLWVDAYECINSCNNVLNALDVVVEEDKNRVEGEALTLRAWCHFELTRMFGQQYDAALSSSQLGVPIILTPTLLVGDNVEVLRSTVEQCYAQVIADLTAAEILLPESNNEFINRYTVAALLARVYLQKEDYAGARDAADRVITSNQFELLTNYADCFGQDNKTDEDVFSLEISDLDGTNALNLYFSINDFGGRGDIEIEPEHLALYEAGDLRKELFFEDVGVTYTGKFNNEFGNIGVIRLAEMYLIRAECNQRLGSAIGADPADDFNLVHIRAGLPSEAGVTLDDILLERRLELAFEGFKVHDVKRLHEMIATMNYNDNKMVYPVPQNEIDINPLLMQNPGY